MTPKADTPLRGIVMIIVAMFIFACQDTITKHLSQTYAAPQILWIRYLFFAVFAVTLSGWNQPLKQVVQSRRRGLQLLRSFIIVFEIGAFILAVRVLSLAETHAIFASFPIIVTAMSAIFLRETVGIRRWSAVFAGFIGILIILRPGFGVFQIEALIALGTAVLFAMYTILTRIVGRVDSAHTSILYMAVIGAAVMTMIGPFYWIEPTPSAWLGLAVLAVTGATGHLLVIKALECAPASVLQPFNFTLLVWVTIMGYLVFDSVPDATTIAGGLIVVASGIYIIFRERARKLPGPPPSVQVKP